MAGPTPLADRVAILEEKMETLKALPEAVRSITPQISQLSARMDSEFSAIRKEWEAGLEKRFREQAEMLDERFAQVDQRFAQVDKELVVLRRDVGIVRRGVSMILKRLDAR